MLGTVKEIASIVGGRLRGAGDGAVAGASIDSRSIAPGQVFFAIVAGRDGHDFVAGAAAAGAAAAVVERRIEGTASIPLIEVPDTLLALQALGSHRRARQRARVVGLTGSCGKTTTKELVAAALGPAGGVLATRGNLNNHLGVPLTLLELGPAHDFAVVEMGANHHGEIDLLTRIADPDVGLVTCVAAAHTEHFGGIDGVQRAKGELFRGMREDAVAVVNLDDPRVRAMQRRPGRTVTYGSDASRSPDVLLEGAREEAAGQVVSIRVEGGTLQGLLALRGAHNALNAAAALAVACALGVDAREALGAMSAVPPASGRGALRGGRRLEVIDDTYNANPASMAAGLSLLRSLAGTRRTVAVLGDMFELGEQAAGMHAEVGRSAARCGVDLVVAVGAHAGDVASGAIAEGASPESVACLASVEEALSGGRLDGMLRPGDLVLVKGSRGMKMERVVETLLYW